MIELPIEASIEVIDGSGKDVATYNIRLATVPQVGDLIRLESLVAAVDGTTTVRGFEVVRTVHSVQAYDPLSEESAEGKGFHIVVIFVKESDDPLFRSAD